MAVFDDEPGAPPKRRIAHEVGQDLTSLSLEEIAARVDLLKAEIARLEQEAASKSAQRAAADLFFKR